MAMSDEITKLQRKIADNQTEITNLQRKHKQEIAALTDKIAMLERENKNLVAEIRKLKAQ